jgi:hypothetical protein
MAAKPLIPHPPMPAKCTRAPANLLGDVADLGAWITAGFTSRGIVSALDSQSTGPRHFIGSQVTL